MGSCFMYHVSCVVMYDFGRWKKCDGNPIRLAALLPNLVHHCPWWNRSKNKHWDDNMPEPEGESLSLLEQWRGKISNYVPTVKIRRDLRRCHVAKARELATRQFHLIWDDISQVYMTKKMRMMRMPDKMRIVQIWHLPVFTGREMKEEHWKYQNIDFFRTPPPLLQSTLGNNESFMWQCV